MSRRISSSTFQFENRMIVLIGIPMTWWTRKASLRTSSPCFSRRHEIRRARTTRTSSSAPRRTAHVLAERAQDVQAGILALLGVELYAEQVSPLDRGGVAVTPVLDERRDVLGVSALEVIAVGEVTRLAVHEARE